MLNRLGQNPEPYDNLQDLHTTQREVSAKLVVEKTAENWRACSTRPNHVYSQQALKECGTRSEAMLEQTLAVDEPRPRLRGPLAPVRVVLGAGKGVGQGIGHALERIARRGRGVLASVTAGQLYGNAEEGAVVDECARALAMLLSFLSPL